MIQNITLENNSEVSPVPANFLLNHKLKPDWDVPKGRRCRRAGLIFVMTAAVTAGGYYEIMEKEAP
jgi:hypothetical protein